MKAVVHHRYGPPEVLTSEEIDTPVIGDDVLVRVGFGRGTGPVGKAAGPDQRMRTWKATMASTERVTIIATRLPEASCKASGTSSEKTIQIMAPAANPSP